MDAASTQDTSCAANCAAVDYASTHGAVGKKYSVTDAGFDRAIVGDATNQAAVG